MFLVAGVNGSGKSSFIKNITRKHPPLKIIDPDAIKKGITGSFGTIYSEAMGAGRTALILVQKCIKNKQSFLSKAQFQVKFTYDIWRWLKNQASKRYLFM